jgi:dienelactone hydrolase
VHPEGKASLFEGGHIRSCVRRLLDAGFTVAGVDLLGQGEFLKDSKSVTTTPLIEGQSVDYALGNRRPLFSERVFDVMTSVRFLRSRGRGKSKVFVLGLSGAGHWVVAACGRAGDDIVGIAIDTAGFRFADLKDAQHVDFLPGAAKYHDLPGMMALCAPHKMWLAGEKSIPDILHRTYAAARAGKHITLFEGKQTDIPTVAASWIVSEGTK